MKSAVLVTLRKFYEIVYTLYFDTRMMCSQCRPMVKVLPQPPLLLQAVTGLLDCNLDLTRHGRGLRGGETPVGDSSVWAQHPRASLGQLVYCLCQCIMRQLHSAMMVVLSG